MNGTLNQIAKHSFLYGFVLSQPFSFNVNAYPILENKELLEKGHLEYGEHSESVQTLQLKLKKLSYYDDDLDGDFGILTEHAVKQFQKDHQIDVSGQADAQTIFSLIDAERKRNVKKIEQLTGSVTPGTHSKEVKIVQEALQYFGYYEGEIDGIYGPLTEKALAIAEEEHQIELRFEVTKTSLETMYENDEKEQEKQAKQIITKTKDKKQAEPKNVKVKSSNPAGLTQVAHSLVGIPYVWGGTTEQGFDCSGFIQYVFASQNVQLPRTVSDMWNFTTPVSTPSVGDIIFFQTYKPGPSHAGIYMGDGKFIHAGESRGVEVSELENSYWKQRYLGAKRVN